VYDMKSFGSFRTVLWKQSDFPRKLQTETGIKPPRICLLDVTETKQ